MLKIFLNISFDEQLKFLRFVIRSKIVKNFRNIVRDMVVNGSKNAILTDIHKAICILYFPGYKVVRIPTIVQVYALFTANLLAVKYIFYNIYNVRMPESRKNKVEAPWVPTSG